MLVWPFNVFVQNFNTIAFFSGNIFYIFFDKLPGNIISLNIRERASNNTILTNLYNLDYALIANPIDALPEASQTIRNVTLELMNTNTLSPGNLTKLQNLLPEIIFYGNPALLFPANQLYSNLFTNISSNTFLNMLIPQSFSIFIVIILKMIPVFFNMIQAFRVYNFNQIFIIFWYDGILGSIMTFVFCIIVLNIFMFIRYFFNFLENILNILNLNSLFDIEIILYLVQILVAFRLTKWIQNFSYNWNSEAFISFYFNLQ